MKSALRGQLGERLIADLIREIDGQRCTGLLRLSDGAAMKAIFFERGLPVYAVSNLANEQVDHRAIKARLTTAGIIETARQRNPNPQQLAETLVEIGAVPRAAMRQVARELAAQIIASLFEWTRG